MPGNTTIVPPPPQNQVTGTGAYLLPDARHYHDAAVAAKIAELLQGRSCASAYDFGCGNGSYSQKLRSAGVKVFAIDGNPNAQLITRGMGVVGDLALPLDLPVLDAVLCLEVGEHVPASYEEVVLANIARHASRMVIMSWGIPGQEGFHHVNCRTNEYIVQRMRTLKWRYDEASAQVLRTSVSCCPWFRRTLMAFLPD